MFDESDLIPFPTDTEGALYYYDGGDDAEGGMTVDMFNVLPMDAAGDYAYWHGNRYSIESDAPVYVEVPHTATSSLDDDLMNESNQVRMLEDWGNYLIRVTGGYYGTEYLMIRVGAMVPEELVQAIEGLIEHPVYDESDYSDREGSQFTDWLDECRDRAVNAINDDDEIDADPAYVIEISHDLARKLAEDQGWSRAEEVDEDELTDALRALVTAETPR